MLNINVRTAISDVIIALGLQACYPLKIPLTPLEEAWGKDLAREYHCEAVTMQHDYDAVTKKRKDGSFWVRLSNTGYYNLCLKDSAALKKISSTIAGSLIGKLSHRENYSVIVVGFYEDERLSNGTFKTICDREMSVDIDNIDSVEATSGWKEKEKDRWQPSDHIIERRSSNYR